MQYEYLFLAMVAVVIGAMGAGVAAGRLRAVAGSLGVCAICALCVGVAAYVVASGQGDEFAALLAVAAGLFTLVISSSAALMSRRIFVGRKQ